MLKLGEIGHLEHEFGDTILSFAILLLTASCLQWNKEVLSPLFCCQYVLTQLGQNEWNRGLQIGMAEAFSHINAPLKLLMPCSLLVLRKWSNTHWNTQLINMSIKELWLQWDLCRCTLYNCTVFNMCICNMKPTYHIYISFLSGHMKENKKVTRNCIRLIMYNLFVYFIIISTTKYNNYFQVL